MHKDGIQRSIKFYITCRKNIQKSKPNLNKILRCWDRNYNNNNIASATKSK